MKPVYLEFCGLNSFEQKAQIDFAKLLAGGVFGIFGDTGSGKSTILDSIHFALYGEIDRAPKSFNDCINHHSDGAFVTFDFEISTDGIRRTYRVKRERRRKSGTTKAYLYERTEGGELLALAEGTREVDERIESIIGLTFADFKTCIALPQGDFAALVKSTQAERVKLVARLFNLEKYGERLTKRVNEQYSRAEEEVNLVRAKMDENEGGDDELFEQTKGSLERDRAAVENAKATLAAKEEGYRALSLLQKEKRAFDELSARLARLEEQSAQMQAKRALLEKLPRAQAVAEKASAKQEASEAKMLANAKGAEARKNHETALERLEKAKATLAENRYDERIVNLSVDLQKIRDAAADRKRAETAKRELDDCIAQYNAIKNQCPQEDFQEKRAQIENSLNALGEDTNLLDYLKTHYKGVLLVDAYGDFRRDLRTLAEKYPQTQTDIETLLKKYTPKQSGETLDIASINLSFKEMERKRRALQTELDALETRRRKYEENEGKKSLLVEQGKHLRVNYALAAEKLDGVKDLGSETSLLATLESCKRAQLEAQTAIERAQTKASEYFAEAQKQEGLSSLHEKTEKDLSALLIETLKENGFASVEEALSLIERAGDSERLKRECTAFFEEYELSRRRYEETDKKQFDGFAEETVAIAFEELQASKTAHETLLKAVAYQESTLARLTALRERYKEQAKLLAEKQKRLRLVDELRLLLRGNKFLEFIAGEYLQEICLSASKTLLSLTSGRYFLQYDKEFKVGDNLDGGNLRAVKTLSGGETFLVSLSLALSLSGSICQRSRRPIEFFFLDEGFGTLDEKLVETVMDVLGKLSKSFSVGLISHIEELKRRIENKVLVTGANERQGSTLRVECY